MVSVYRPPAVNATFGSATALRINPILAVFLDVNYLQKFQKFFKFLKISTKISDFFRYPSNIGFKWKIMTRQIYSINFHATFGIFWPIFVNSTLKFRPKMGLPSRYSSKSSKKFGGGMGIKIFFKNLINRHSKLYKTRPLE